MSAPAAETTYQPATQHRAILGALLEHGGTMSTAEVAMASGVHRDTARRFLADDAAAGWVERHEAAGVETWRLGPELPRLGLAFLALLGREQDQIRLRFEAATIPHDWESGHAGLSWRPNTRQETRR